MASSNILNAHSSLVLMFLLLQGHIYPFGCWLNPWVPEVFIMAVYLPILSWLTPKWSRVLSFTLPLPTKDFCKTDDPKTLTYTVQLMLILGTLKQRYQEILDLNVHRDKEKQHHRINAKVIFCGTWFTSFYKTVRDVWSVETADRCLEHLLWRWQGFGESGVASDSDFHVKCETE